MGVVIVGDGSFEVRKFLIEKYAEPLVIVVGTKSLADKLIIPDCEICDELINTTNFYISDELIGLPAKEICDKHLGEPISFIKEVD